MVRWYLEKYDPDNTGQQLFIANSVNKIIQLAPTNKGTWPADFVYHLNRRSLNETTARFGQAYDNMLDGNEIIMNEILDGGPENYDDPAVFQGNLPDSGLKS